MAEEQRTFFKVCPTCGKLSKSAYCSIECMLTTGEDEEDEQGFFQMDDDYEVEQ